MKILLAFLLILVSLSFNSCKKLYSVSDIDASQISIKSNDSSHTAIMDSFIGPYKLKLGKSMGDTIAFCPINYDVSRDFGLLCIWTGDAIQWYCDSMMDVKVDVASTNYGGLRLPSIPKGPVLLGLMYELMPFDNALTLIEVDSATLKEYIEFNAGKGYWPYSNRLNIVVNKDNKLLSWNVKKISDGNKFLIAVNDYVASGGDNHTMLKGKPNKITSVMLRDVFTAYAKHQKTLQAIVDNRYIKK